MALLFIDSFDHYATADITEKWTQLRNPVAGDDARVTVGAYGRHSSNGLQMTTEGASWYSTNPAITLAPTGTVAIAGFAFKATNFSQLAYYSGTLATNHAVCCFWKAGERAITLIINSNGTLSICRGVDLTCRLSMLTVLATSTQALQTNVWQYIELKADLISGSPGGSAAVHVNGIEWITYSGATTEAAADGWDEFTLGTYVTTGTADAWAYYDDLYVCDGSGALCNDFLGDVLVGVLHPDGVGTTTGWTASAGANYACTEDITPNDDTDYVETDGVGDKDTYTFENVAPGADIIGVQILASIRKTTDGPGLVKHVIRSGGSDYDQIEIGIGGTTYSYTRTIHETDPATGVAWTESGVNAAEFGVKKTG